MTLVPLYGFVQGDTMGVLVLAHEDMRIAEVMEKLGSSTALRAGLGREGCALFSGGKRLEEHRTVADYRLRALDRVDLRRERNP